MNTPSLPEFPTRAATERRLKANLARSAKLAPAELARRNAEHQAERDAQAAERKRIRAELDAQHAAFFAAHKG